METTGKIVKITLEYENETKSISGEQAEKWLDAVNGMCVNLQNRGQNPFEHMKFDWKQER